VIDTTDLQPPIDVKSSLSVTPIHELNRTKDHQNIEQNKENSIEKKETPISISGVGVTELISTPSAPSVFPPPHTSISDLYYSFSFLA
jgi:hypothetical protein